MAIDLSLYPFNSDAESIIPYWTLEKKKKEVVMKMVGAISAKNLIRIKMMDFIMSVIIIEKKRARKEKEDSTY